MREGISNSFLIEKPLALRYSEWIFNKEEEEWELTLRMNWIRVGHRNIKNFHREAIKSEATNHFSSLILRKDLFNVGREKDLSIALTILLK